MANRSWWIVLLVCVGCSSGPKPANLAQVCNAPAADPSQVANVESGNAAFALGLLSTFADGGNLVISPYSVSTALDLTYAGAATTTADQMAQVLGLGSAATGPGPAVADIACTAETDGSDDGNQLAIANALFGEQTFTFEPAFLSTLSTDYGAPLQDVDFKTDPSAAITTINAWVSTETEGVVPSLLSSADVDGDTRLVLVNALYFKGTWQNGFDPGDTHTGSFKTSATSQVSTPMMSQSGPGTFGSYQGSGFAIAELPYKGGQVALDIVLPTAVDGLAMLTAGLTAAELQSWFGQLQSVQFDPLTVPRFTLDTRTELAAPPPAVGPLQTLGMLLPFEMGQADFSGMDGAQDLFLQAVVHEAVIDVDETGTTAAAATSVSVGVNLIAGPPPLSFVADHPFLFVLRDLTTGTLLFIGEVTDPTQS